jgi:pyruvate/2-oxoglutarate dehydrogenase complex dihydrolipoamide acyltransferase (E2) component
MLLCRILSNDQFRFRRIVTVLPMPKLSPTMKSVVISQWHVKEGDFVQAYSLMCDVTTRQLTNDSSPEEACLQIEIQEDCVVSRIMRNEGDTVEAGHPMAILRDEDERSIHATTF